MALVDAAHFSKNRQGAVLRVALPLLILAFCLHSLSDQLVDISMSNIQRQLSGIPPTTWLAAAVLTGLSLWSVGRYDGVAHAHFQTGVGSTRATWAGSSAIALAQSLGFGLATGTLARWRMLPDISLPQAAKISAFVSVSFMASLASVTAVMCLILPAPHWSLVPSLIIATALPCALIAFFAMPRVHLRCPWWGSVTLQLPTLIATTRMLFWTLIDTFTAALAFYVVLSTTTDVSFAIVLPAFLLALGAGLASSTPAGIGPFEIALLALLPTVPPEALLTAIVAFRLVYYAAPAIGAVLVMIKPLKPRKTDAVLHLVPQLAQAADPQVDVVRQNGGSVLAGPWGARAIWHTGQTVTALFGAMRGPPGAGLKDLRLVATSTGRSAMLYKCTARDAVRARSMGWRVMHIADDATLAPACFDVNTATRRSLRRKLRAADKAGVDITQQNNPNLETMAQVDAAWQQRNGTPRGGTMGRFSASYVAQHQVFCAYWQGRMIGFVTFQTGAHGWALDVMRCCDAAPDGTMHALVSAGILAARERGVACVNLTSVPACPDPSQRVYRWAARQVVSRAGGPGLRQFKSAFAPEWCPRYAAAPTTAALLIGLADITREVHFPPPLQDSTAAARSRPSALHNNDENYELASHRAS